MGWRGKQQSCTAVNMLNCFAAEVKLSHSSPVGRVSPAFLCILCSAHSKCPGNICGTFTQRSPQLPHPFWEKAYCGSVIQLLRNSVLGNYNHFILLNPFSVIWSDNEESSANTMTKKNQGEIRRNRRGLLKYYLQRNLIDIKFVIHTTSFFEKGKGG